MLVTITSIDAAGPSLKARRLVFAGEEPPRLTSAAVVRQLGLKVEVAIDRAGLEAALLAAERPQAWDRALRMLGYRDRTTKEIRQGLRDSGYSADVTGATIDRLSELGLLDDARFAYSWVRSRTAAGYGSRRISRELAEKGVPAEAIAAALMENTGVDTLELARMALHGRTAPAGKERERLVRRLLSRGFSLEVALQAVQPEDGSDSEA